MNHRKFLKSEKADTEIAGHQILLGITVLGVSVISIYSMPAIKNLQDMAELRNVEQAFAVLDSRASRAVLGASQLQTTEIDLGGGSLTVVPNSTEKSYVVIKSENDTFNVTVPMGKISYQLGDRVVAYEGGGVWSKYPSGSIMLSPPEFHYNGVTLTLPVFYILGNASLGGKGSATVSVKKNNTLVLYPNTSCEGCGNRTNPVNYTMNGKVYVNISSEFYDGWADFVKRHDFIEVVEKNATTKTTSMLLTVVPNTLGEESPITNPIIFRGLDSHDPSPLNNFSFNLTADPISSLNWQMEAISGLKYLVIQLTGSATKVRVFIGYRDSSFLGAGYSEYSETWENDTAFTPVNNKVYIDLLDPNVQMEYVKTNVPNGVSCWPQIKSNVVNSTGITWTDRVVNTTIKYQSLFNVTQHYFQLMAPDATLTRCSPGGSDHVDYTISTMFQKYNVTGALTYLYITENKIDVGIS